MATEQVFAVFPYLRTTERVAIRGIEFRSSRDLADMPDDARKHLTTLCEMFFLQDGVRIVDMTCACVELPEDTERRQMWLRLLDEARLLVGYLYSASNVSGTMLFHMEDSAIFTFRVGDTACHPGMVPTSLVWQDELHPDRAVRVDSKKPPKDMLTPGYAAMRDGNVHFWVAEGSRIYPELPLVRLNITQSLSSNLKMFLSHAHNWAWERLFFLPYEPTPEVSARVFVALDWYLRSCRETIGEAEAIVDLAIALESVLALRSGDGLTDRFKDAVMTLLGPVARLDTWLDQFYTARSKAVHEGKPHQTMFLATDCREKRKPSPETAIVHRSLLAYGRQIFRLCATNILSGVANSERVGLAELFFHNKERIDNICKTLNEKDTPSRKRLLNASRYVFGLEEFAGDTMEAGVRMEAVLGGTRLLLQAYKESIPNLLPDELSALDAVLAAAQAGPSAQLDRIKECAACLRGRTLDSRSREEAYLNDIILAFLTYATHPEFTLRAYMTEYNSSSSSPDANEAG